MFPHHPTTRLPRLLSRWHTFLSLPRQPHSPWYHARLAAEIDEQHSASTVLRRLSETADITYIFTRAAHDGVLLPFPRELELPLPRRLVVTGYMLAKYTSRWGFYRAAGWLCRCRRRLPEDGKGKEERKMGADDYRLDQTDGAVREVVNPRKDCKILAVAKRHGLDEERFLATCRRLRWAWPLLP